LDRTPRRIIAKWTDVKTETSVTENRVVSFKNQIFSHHFKNMRIKRTVYEIKNGILVVSSLRNVINVLAVSVEYKNIKWYRVSTYFNARNCNYITRWIRSTRSLRQSEFDPLKLIRFSFFLSMYMDLASEVGHSFGWVTSLEGVV